MEAAAALRALLAPTLVAAIVAGCGGEAAPSGSASEPSTPSIVQPVDGAPGTADGAGPSIAGCRVFPNDDPWNRDVSGDPLDAASGALIARMSPGEALGLALGTTEEFYGGRYVVVPREQPLATVDYGVAGEDYSAQSDHGPFPIPLDAPIQGGSQADPNPTSGDRHVLVVQRGTCELFELYNAERTATGFRVSSSARWDLATGAPRPRGWTSADGAGLPIFPGLLRWEEVASGTIRHALRVTLPAARAAFVAPANHCGPDADASLPPFGTRVRLSASFDVSRYGPSTRVILQALQRYGLILADRGAAWQVSGVSDPGFSDALQELRAMPIPGSAFEVVQLGPIQGC